MLRSIIIEDELSNRETLNNLIRQFCPGKVEVLGFAGGVQEAIFLAKKTTPDLIFLDIELSGGNGFQVLDGLLGQEGFQVVFVTAYDEFAIQAIKYAALDYLVKPIDVDELVLAVEKAAREKLKSPEARHFSHRALTRQNTLSLQTQSGLHILPLSQIIHCEAEGSYSRLILSHERPLTLSKTLKELEELLPVDGFIRVHRSHIVNLDSIRGYSPNNGGQLELKNGENIPVSRRKKKDLLSRLKESD